jgi:hypothetical protein
MNECGLRVFKSCSGRLETRAVVSDELNGQRGHLKRALTQVVFVLAAAGFGEGGCDWLKM